MRLFAGALSAAALAALCSGAEWSQFRGPNAAGVADAAKLPVQFGPAKNVIWKTPLPPGHSSPVIWGHRIFLTAAEGGSRADAGRDKVVDDGGNLLAFTRMDGAKVLSIESAIRKAETAASSRAPTGRIVGELEFRLAHATGGRLTNLKGGLPIVVEGITIGGIGVGSQTGDEDLEVARAGVAALAGAATFD